MTDGQNYAIERDVSMLAAFKRSPADVVLREVPMPEPGRGEILIKVMSCGICGGDIGSSDEYVRFGHEIAGEVIALGAEVHRLSPGMRVAIESGAFCGVCDVCRNGRPDLCRNVTDGSYCGCAEYAVVKEKNAVVLPDALSYRHAALIEPLGVAIDLVKTAEIGMGDHVLVLGAGSIGLMALELARRAGASRIWAACRSRATRKIELVREFGAEDVVLTDSQSISDYPFPRGGVDKVLITAPPAVIPQALGVMRYGGIAAFIGFGGDGAITIDAHRFHTGKLQLRGAFSSPGIYFPLAIEALTTGMVDADALISHAMPLKDIAALMHAAGCERESAVKCVMLAEQ